MSDILFRYLLMARRRDRSSWRRLLFADEQLLEAGVEQLVESAAARIEVTSQHERIDRWTATAPASRRHTVRFYDVAQPNRPVPGRFEERSEEFPLRGTLRVYTCPRCRGRGHIRCRRCGGRGQVRCSTCGGRGRDAGRRRCVGCSGSGRKVCFRCNGDGRETCYECRGEGELASWQVEAYRWLIERRRQEQYPLPDTPSALRRAFDRWLKVDADLVASLEPAAAAEHLRYETPEALEVASRADDDRRRLEDEARRSSDRYLFHRTDRSLSPTGYTVVRLAGRARFYWLVGRGERAREVSPAGRLDGRKCLGWLGLGSGGALGWEGLVQSYHLALPEVLDGLRFLSEVPSPWLAGGAAAGWLLALAGARRTLHRQPPVKTVGLLPAGGEPTPWLTCLAYLGSYTGRLKVLDRAYDTQSERLLGKMRAERQSESLTVELADGRKVRLVEVARPHRLSDGQLRLMLEALDGVLIVEERGRPAGDLARRLRSVRETAIREPAVREPAVGEPAVRQMAVGTAVVDRSGSADPEDPAPLALEAIRRAYVEDVRAGADWDAVFGRIWRPLGDLLASEFEAGQGLVNNSE